MSVCQNVGLSKRGMMKAGIAGKKEKKKIIEILQFYGKIVVKIHSNVL